MTLAQVDHQLELQRNSQLRQAPIEQQNEQLHHTERAMGKRLAMLRSVLLKSFLSMASAVVVAYVTTTTRLAIPTPTAVLAISSAFCFAWATLGRLGWAGQTIKGDSSVERVDQAIFHILYWAGMYLATAAAL